MKTFHSLFIYVLVSFSFSTFASDCFEKGTSSLWKFDQKKSRIELVEADEQEVCHTFTNQLNANFKFRFYKQDKLVHEMKVFWADLTINDIIDENKKHQAVIKKDINYKILKFPIQKNQVDRYVVVSLLTNKIVSRGKL